MSILTEVTLKNEIIVQNKYYTSGLREQTINNYYQKNKHKIIKETNNRPITLVIAYDTNEFVIRRNINEKLIYLNNENFDKLVHGRIASMFVELGSPTNLWCIDIDPGKNVKENETKKAVEDLVLFFDEMYDKGYMKYDGLRITSTSRGYHIFATMKQRYAYEKNYNNAFEALQVFKKDYVIDKRRDNEDQIILDLSVMKRRGSHVIPNALNRNGLICMDVTENWETFKRSDAIVRS